MADSRHKENWFLAINQQPISAKVGTTKQSSMQQKASHLPPQWPARDLKIALSVTSGVGTVSQFERCVVFRFRVNQGRRQTDGQPNRRTDGRGASYGRAHNNERQWTCLQDRQRPDNVLAILRPQKKAMQLMRNSVWDTIQETTRACSFPA